MRGAESAGRERNREASKPRRCSVEEASCWVGIGIRSRKSVVGEKREGGYDTFFMNMVKTTLSPAASTIFSQHARPSGPPRAWSNSRKARGRLILPSLSMSRQSSTPSAASNFCFPARSSTQQVTQSKTFSTCSSSSVPFAGSRFR